MKLPWLQLVAKRNVYLFRHNAGLIDGMGSCILRRHHWSAACVAASRMTAIKLAIEVFSGATIKDF